MIQVTAVWLYARWKPNIERGTFLLNVDSRLPKWNPELEAFPSTASFLFVSSALGKIRGLASSELKSTFLSWSPEKPPAEPNELKLNGLIVRKAHDLVIYSVSELTHVHQIDPDKLPKRFLVGDVHPSIGHPGASGDFHLIKPKREMRYPDMLKFIHSPWEKFGDKPVTVQLASAYTMVNQKGKPLSSNGVFQDSVFMTYESNPLQTLQDVNDYISSLKEQRFPGFSRANLANKLSAIAGGIFNEYLYLYARQKGIEVTISSAMSCRLAEHQSIEGIGAGGLTPAIIGWIDQQAKLRVN